MAATTPTPNPYSINLYDADILPGTKMGRDLYMKATESVSEDKRLDFSADNALTVKFKLESASHEFCWNKIINIPRTYAQDGTGSNFIDLLRNPERISDDEVRFSAAVTWANPNFLTRQTSITVLKIDPLNVEADRVVHQRRVRSEMVAKWLKNNFSEASIKSLALRSEQYLWIIPAEDGGGFHYDGPTMLKLILDEIQPSTTIGTDNFRTIIQNCRLPKHGYNITAAMEEIEQNVKQIARHGETYDSLRLHVFNCLMSAKNSSFRTWVERVKMDISSGTGEYKNHSPQMVINAAKRQYGDMIASGSWDRIDPQQSQMVALTTQLLDVKLKLAEAAKGTGSDGGGKITGGGNKTNGPEEWQFGKVGDTKQMYNKTWWWCSEHNNGQGMYVRHPPADHETWRQKKKTGERYTAPDYRSSATASGGDVKPSGSDSANAKPSSAISHLELGSELKQVLYSYGLSNTDADAIWEQSLARSKN